MVPRGAHGSRPLRPGEPRRVPEPTPRPAAVDVAVSEVPRASASPRRCEKKAAASINAFGVELYRRMLADGVLGPRRGRHLATSIVLALAMARAGAKGETAAQMDTVLHAAGWDQLGTGLNALDQALASATRRGRRTTEGARARAPDRQRHVRQRGWAIAQDYLDAIAAAFGAGLRLVDYEADPEAARMAINAWVSKHTANRSPSCSGRPTSRRTRASSWSTRSTSRRTGRPEFEQARPRSTCPSRGSTPRG